MTTIAGHTFDFTPTGRRCIGFRSSGTPCNRAWIDIRCCTAEDINAMEIAHVGQLNAAELNEIIKEKEREENAIWQAIQASCSTRA